jgi:hypothetical protein
MNVSYEWLIIVFQCMSGIPSALASPYMFTKVVPYAIKMKQKSKTKNYDVYNGTLVLLVTSEY